MTVFQREMVALIVVALIIQLSRLIAARKFPVGLGLTWIALFAAALFVLAFPEAMDAITRITGARYPVSAMTLVGLCIILLFVFHLSMAVFRLERRQTELVRKLAMALSERNREAAPVTGDGASQMSPGQASSEGSKVG